MMDRKGTAGSIALVFIVGIWVLSLVFSSVFVSENPTRAELYASTGSQKQQFEAQAAAIALLSRERLRKDLGRFPALTESQRQEISGDLKSRIRETLSLQSRNYYFKLKGYELQVKKGSLSGMKRVSYIISSPSPEPLRVVVGVGESR